MAVIKSKSSFSQTGQFFFKVQQKLRIKKLNYESIIQIWKLVRLLTLVFFYTVLLLPSPRGEPHARLLARSRPENTNPRFRPRCGLALAPPNGPT